MGDWLFDLGETLFGEQEVVSEWTLGIFGSRMYGRQESITEESIARIRDINDCHLLVKEVL